MLSFFHFALPAIYSLLFLFVYQPPQRFVIFLIGLYLGFSLLFLDRILHIFFIEPEAEYSQILIDTLRQKKFLLFFKTVLLSRAHQQHLITRSVLFLAAYAGTAFFVITSTGSTIGTGIVLGIGLHYSFDFFRYARNSDLLHKHFLWQIKKTFKQQEMSALCGAICIFFLLLTVLAFAGA